MEDTRHQSQAPSTDSEPRLADSAVSPRLRQKPLTPLESEALSCQRCGEAFSILPRYATHRTKRNDGWIGACPYCAALFYTRSDSMTHRLECPSQAAETGPIADEQLVERLGCKVQVSQSDPDAHIEHCVQYQAQELPTRSQRLCNRTCTYCFTQSKTARSRRQHERYCRSDPTARRAVSVCCWCSKGYVRPWILRKHEPTCKMNSGWEANLKICPYCGSKLVSAPILKQHLTTCTKKTEDY